MAIFAKMAKQGNEETFSYNCSRFKTLNESDKDELWSKKNAKNTNDSTKVWIKCLREYLCEKNLPELETLSNEDLGDVLSNFYTEVKKKKVPDDADDESDYKTSTLRVIRSALTRHFKETRKIDIRQHPSFLKSIEMFICITKANKEKSLGVIESKPPICDEDMNKLAAYFEQTMLVPPIPAVLQEMVIFYVIHYVCRCGRENLRLMTTLTFTIATDPAVNKHRVSSCPINPIFLELSYKVLYFQQMSYKSYIFNKNSNFCQ